MKGTRLGQIAGFDRCHSGAAAYAQSKPQRLSMSTLKRTVLMTLIVVGLVVVVFPFAFAASPANAAWPEDWTQGSALWYWIGVNPHWTYYRLGTSIGQTMPYWGGPTFTQHAKIAACRWSNDQNPDNAIYGVTPTTYNFYYDDDGYSSGQQYDHSLGFGQVDNGFVAQTFPYNSGWGWYIRFSTNFWWTTNPSVQDQRYDFQSAAAHEFGHALGLFHGSNSNYGSYTDANRPTMFALGARKKVTWQRTPSALGDFEGLNWIYGSQ